MLSATAFAALVGWGVLAFAPLAAAQVPAGGTVVGGNATITTAPGQVTVNQTSGRGVIDWRSFSIGHGSHVDFRQPGASSVTLNRVTGPDPSVIAGRLTANGQVILVNGAGIFFADGARVDVGALVASTANILDPQRFMAGGPITFDVPSPDANAGVVNAGNITVRDGGLVGLVGNMAANNGVINARLGRVVIGGAETFTVDLAGDGLINFQVGQPVSRQPVDRRGKKVPLASNTGTINADGGMVRMTARAAGDVVDAVVNVGGAVRARAVSQEGGVLVLDGGDGGTVNITGNLDVSGKETGQRGGRVTATAKGGTVTVASGGVIDASGAAGGGQVRIGGSLRGKGPIANARDTTVATGARIDADATRRGDGGTVVAWSDNATVFGGTVTARGGPQGGDGGIVETSGRTTLSIRDGASVNASAVAGRAGTWLLDPDDVTIDGAQATVFSSTLQGGTDVVISTSGAGSAPGDITLLAGAAITWTSTASLTLNADRHIVLNGAIDASAPALGDRVILNAALTDPSGSVSNGAGGTIVVSGGVLAVAAGSGGVDFDSAAILAGRVRFNVTGGGGVTMTNPGNGPAVIEGTVSGPVGIRADAGLTIPASGFATNDADISLQSVGPLTVDGPLDAGSGTLSLQADSVSAGGGAVTAGTINFSVINAIDLTNADNAIGMLATAPSAAGGNVSIFSASSMTVAAGGITAGPSMHLRSAGQLVVGGSLSTQDPSGTLSLESTAAGDAGAIRQTDGTISAGTIFLDADAGTDVIQTGGNIVGTDPAGFLSVTARSVQLPSPTNDLATIFGFSSTDFRYVDANAVTLGSGVCSDICGLTMGAGRYLDISADSISIFPGAQIGTAPGPVDNLTGVVVLRPTTPGTPIVIGGTAGTGLTQSALALGIRAGTLRIGSIGRAAGTMLGGTATATEGAAGAITIQGLDLGDRNAAVLTLVLESGAAGAAISQTAPLVVSTLATAVVGDGSVVLTQDNASLTAIAHVARISDSTLGVQTGGFQYTSQLGVAVGGAGGATVPLIGQRDSGTAPGLPANAAIVTSGGAVGIAAGTDIALHNAIATGGGDLSLAARSGGITGSAEGGISAGGGTLTLQSASDVEIRGTVTAGVLNFTVVDGLLLMLEPTNAIGEVAAAPSSATGPLGTAVITSSVPVTIGAGGIAATDTVSIRSLGRLVVNGDVAASRAVVLVSGVEGQGDILLAGGTIAAPGISLISNGAGSIIQTGGRIVSPSGQLDANAGGTVQLANPANNVAAVSGSAGTDFRYVDADTVQLGGACGNDVCGITIGAGRYLDVAANGFSLLPGVPIGAASAPAAAAGDLLIDNPAGVTVLRPATAGTAMTLGGAGTGLTEAAVVSGIRTGTLRIGSIGRAAGTVLGGTSTAAESAAGPLTIQGIDLGADGSAIATLVLESAAAGTAIGQTGRLQVNHLATAVAGSGAVELTLDNAVAGLAHVARISDTALATQGGTFRYVDGTSIPVVSVAGSGTPLIGQRGSGNTAGAPANTAILTSGGDVTLVSRTGSIEFIDGLAATGATVRLSAGDRIFQSAAGGVVANGLLAIAGGAVDLSTAAGLNDVRLLSGSASGSFGDPGDFRLINAATVTVPAAGVPGDSLVTSVTGVHAGPAATLELAIGSGDIVVGNTALTAPDGLVLLRRVAGATGSEIILDTVSFDTGAGSPNLVVLDLTGSPALSPGNFTALKTGTTPPGGTSPVVAGPNPDGGILLNDVNAGGTTVYLVGGPGATVGGSGVYGVLGIYLAHGDPVALTGSVRRIDPTAPHAVTAPFDEPFDSTTFAGFYVRRMGAPIAVQLFNSCPIGTGICPGSEAGVPPSVQRPPEEPAHQVGEPDHVWIDFVPDRVTPTLLDLSNAIMVNQGNEYFFNADDEQRKRRAARGGK